MRDETDRNGFCVTVFHLPRTKVALAGEDVYWAAQTGTIDPLAAMKNHLDINKPSTGDALFSWRHQSGLRPLTRSQFLQCLQTASDSLGGGALKGHGIRIGGTLEYLLRGVPLGISMGIPMGICGDTPTHTHQKPTPTLVGVGLFMGTRDGYPYPYP
ncbi:uncharacterized protein F5891DRAFT_1189444 [Suillus fuscotomentosus]|uniref:Uncharacterized protein n=1 Tax=Suillus fuscotomentosus TaxID=1912939 RepID=A0AAD4E4M8_9AGAM|nr:uncharacterized protein F5891DRAFT_1189444 [Suillus fuscotomentosus]KAG1899635.1 hypothetical protein F5891DRAFT_1189444 [Suillus fuscotomentosus]